jgi:hypothetical protein
MKMNESPLTHKRTGFYPAAAFDYLEPLQLLNGWVDHLIFCDLHKTPNNRLAIQEIREKISKQSLPEASFLLGDALSAFEYIKPVDVFFLRRDSCNEGGSGLALLHADRIRIVLNVIKPGGLLITDKANGFLWLTRMLSGKSPQYPVGQRNLFLSPLQPWTDHNLYSVTVA